MKRVFIIFAGLVLATTGTSGIGMAHAPHAVCPAGFVHTGGRLGARADEPPGAVMCIGGEFGMQPGPSKSSSNPNAVAHIVFDVPDVCHSLVNYNTVEVQSAIPLIPVTAVTFDTLGQLDIVAVKEVPPGVHEVFARMDTGDCYAETSFVIEFHPVDD